MQKLLTCLFALSCWWMACTPAPQSPLLRLESASFSLGIGDQGSIVSLTDKSTSQNYLTADTTPYLLSLRVAQAVITPVSAAATEKTITLTYENGMTAEIQFEQKEHYFTFELIGLSDPEAVDLVLWGPYYTTIYQVIGETVGVVRSEDFALGIQSLNLKTLGGYPWNESDRMPAFDIFREENIEDMHPKADGSVLYRVEAAKPTRSGSSLQAYCRNRSEPRMISDFRHEKILAPAYEDGGVVGSKIALFGCPKAEVLQTLGKIEVAEGLPHPMIDGQWGKTAPGANAAYIISNFTEDNVDEAIALTQQAGLKYLYHYGKTFENWGHFELYTGEFPDGIASLKRCVEKAEAAGIMLGTHFLSNFITPNDPYVTPVPDPRLAIVGSSVLTESIAAHTTEIPIASPDFFQQMENNTLKTVRIGDELIRYGSVSETAPWKLLDCQRGAWETKASAHEKEASISKLLDHAYKVFLTNADLTVEMSTKMAEIYNQTGLRQISFDGLEGNRSTGLGTYGESLMPYTWYHALSDELKTHLIIDASRTTHFFWHIYSRMNWGEPWYGGFRESQTEYRFNNQAYFQRNYMPGMLGWFKLTGETSLADIEWLLARSAGYDAGYAFVASAEAVEKNGQTDQILALLGEWEQLRIGGAFTEAQKEQLRDAEKEFSLQKQNGQTFLKESKAQIFTHEKKVRQPGEPLHSTFDFQNIGAEQSVHFTLTAQHCTVSEMEVEFNRYKTISLPVSLQNGETLKYVGGKQATIYNRNWQALRVVEINPTDFTVKSGENSLSFDCQFAQAEKEAKVKLEIRTWGVGEEVLR